MPLHPPNVLIATLCYGGALSHEYAHAFLELAGSAGQPAASFGLVTAAPGAHGPGARNALVKRFLESPAATHLLFIDADVRFEPASVRRLLALNEDVAAGRVPERGFDAPRRAPEGLGEARDGFVTVARAESAFMMITRGALERLVRAASATEGCGQGPFDGMVDPATGVYLGEDAAFCRRFRDLGGKVWLDTESQLRRTSLGDRDTCGLRVPSRAETQLLTSARLVLAPVGPEDTTDLWDAIDSSRPELEAWLPTARFNTDIETVHRHAVACVDDWDRGRACRFTVRDRRTGAFYGVVGIEEFSALKQSVELGYWLRTDATGRGIATEACRTLIGWLFSRLNVRRIRAAVATGNRASLAVVRRLGFRFEGTALRVEQCQGRWLDHAQFALLATDELEEPRASRSGAPQSAEAGPAA